MEIHHVGYLVKDMESSLVSLMGIGYEIEEQSKYDYLRDANISFLVNGSERIELVEPNSPNSPLNGLMKKFRNSHYHICYKVDSLSESIVELRNKSFHMFKEPEIAPCMGNRKVAFLNHPFIGMIELVEKKVDENELLQVFGIKNRLLGGVLRNCNPQYA